MSDERIENLYELDFKEIGKRIGSGVKSAASSDLAKNVGATLKRAGANALDNAKLQAKANLQGVAAPGAADVTKVVQALFREWVRFANQNGINSRAPDTDTFIKFLKARVNDGENHARIVKKMLDKNAAPDTEAPAGKSDNAPLPDHVQKEMERQRGMGHPKGDAHDLAAEERARLGKEDNAVFYGGLGDYRDTARMPADAASKQSHAFNTVMGELKKSAPNRNAVFKLTKAIIDQAKKEGGPEKERAKAFLKHLKKPQSLQKVPNIANLKLETVLRAVEFAEFLLEAETVDRKVITETYDRLFEAPIAMDDFKAILTAIARAHVNRQNDLRNVDHDEPRDEVAHGPGGPSAPAGAPSASSSDRKVDRADRVIQFNQALMNIDMQSKSNGAFNDYEHIMNAAKDGKGIDDLRMMVGQSRMRDNQMASVIAIMMKHMFGN